MRASVSSLDKQLDNYISVLNDPQKQALLTVAKSLAEGDNEYSNEFKAELDSRYAEYKDGSHLVSEEDANKRISNIIKAK